MTINDILERLEKEMLRFPDDTVAFDLLSEEKKERTCLDFLKTFFRSAIKEAMESVELKQMSIKRNDTSEYIQWAKGYNSSIEDYKANITKFFE